MWPIRMGARKVSWSIEAVTTGPRAWRIADMAPAASVHCMILPQTADPRVFASPGSTMWLGSILDWVGGFAFAMKAW